MWSNSCSNNADRRRWLARSLALAAAIAAGCGPAAAENVDNWRDAVPRAQPLGGGDLTWFGLRIYHATLWSATLPFDPTRPFALQLHYYRSISRTRLVNASIDEIRRLSQTPLTDSTLQRWRATLNAAFVDVSDGDELTGVYLPEHGMRLYDRQRLLADLNDTALARAFFDIWLNENSRDQTLRQRLLGGQP